MGRTYRHDSKNSWSKPKFKRNKRDKSKSSTTNLEDYDYFEPTSQKKESDIMTELGEDLENHESNRHYK